MELISLLFDHHRAKAAYEAGLSKAPTLITLEGEGKNNVWGKKMLRMMLKEVLNKQHGFSKGESWGASVQVRGAGAGRGLPGLPQTVVGSAWLAEHLC